MWPRGVTVSTLALNPAIAVQIRARPSVPGIIDLVRVGVKMTLGDPGWILGASGCPWACLGDPGCPLVALGVPWWPWVVLGGPGWLWVAMGGSGWLWVALGGPGCF